MVLQEHQGMKDHLVLKDPQEQQAAKVILVHLDLLDLQAHLEM